MCGVVCRIYSPSVYTCVIICLAWQVAVNTERGVT